MFSETFPASDYANGARIELDLSMEPLVLGPGTYRLDAAQNLVRRAFAETVGAAPRVREAEAVAYG